MTRILPDCSPSYGVRPVDSLPAAAARRLVAAPRSRRPGRPRADRSCRARLPASTTRAYFEHAFLARQMGVELVEGRDLFVHDESRLHAHDVRAASGWTSSTAASTTTSSTRSPSAPTRCSALPGCSAPTAPATSRSRTRSARASPTTRRSTAYVPEMIRYYLGEEPLLDNVPTYLPSDPEQLDACARATSTQLVVKAVERERAATGC